MKNKNVLSIFKQHNLTHHEILISYHGPFDSNIISQLGKKIRLLDESNPKLSEKIFKVFIELAQNVAFYSAERSNIGDEANTGVGSLVIGQTDEHILFATGNAVNKEDKKILDEKCLIINKLNRDELRQYKRDQRSLLPGTNGTANIGLIMVALLTRQKLDVEFFPYENKQEYFTVQVDIPRK